MTTATARKGFKLSALDIALIAIGAAIYAVALLSTAWLQVIPGIASFRWANFIPFALGLLFGPFVGGLGAGIGNLIADALGGYLSIGSFGGFWSNYLQAYLVAKLVRENVTFWRVLIFTLIAGYIQWYFHVQLWTHTAGLYTVQADLAGFIPGHLCCVLPRVLAPVVTLPLIRPMERLGVYWHERFDVNFTSLWPMWVMLIVGVPAYVLALLSPQLMTNQIAFGIWFVWMVAMGIWFLYDAAKMENRF
jgi:uncharacterized membrane protein